MVRDTGDTARCTHAERGRVSAEDYYTSRKTVVQAGVGDIFVKKVTIDGNRQRV
jgi:hypothetical protein